MDFLILTGLIVLVAIMAATEIAFFSVGETRLRALAEDGHKRASMALHIRGNPQRLLLTLSILEYMIMAWIPIYAVRITTDRYQEGLLTLPQMVSVVTSVVGVFIMLFGGVVPKTWAGKMATPLVLNMAYPVYWLEWIMTLPLLVLEPLVDKLTGGKGMAVPSVTEEELKIMLDAGGRAGQIETEEVTMIKNVFQLNDITAEDAMSPRLYVFALDGNCLLKDVQAQLFKAKFSRIPIYDGSLDNVTGIVSKTKALMELAQGHDGQRLKDIAQPALFVPASKPADDLMKQFQQEHRHIAVVVNEFGGTMGIVTLEDLLEEVVGEIMDETDITEELIKRIGKTHVLVHGRTEVRRINEFFKAEFDDEEPTTISGLIQTKLGRIPAVGEEIRIGHCRIVVHEADAKSIKSVQIFKEEKPIAVVESLVEQKPKQIQQSAGTYRSFF
ncbi:MAG: HlyC/CorC family transporter [Nitrospira sp.]|nr:HlyC/CorC family transporter [Nitrospira sp.]